MVMMAMTFVGTNHQEQHVQQEVLCRVVLQDSSGRPEVYILSLSSSSSPCSSTTITTTHARLLTCSLQEEKKNHTKKPRFEEREFY